MVSPWRKACSRLLQGETDDHIGQDLSRIPEGHEAIKLMLPQISVQKLGAVFLILGQRKATACSRS